MKLEIYTVFYFVLLKWSWRWWDDGVDLCGELTFYGLDLFDIFELGIFEDFYEEFIDLKLYFF